MLRRAWEDAGRAAGDLQVVPYAVLPAPGKLAHYAELGIEEVVLQLPSADETGVLKVLDEYASYRRPRVGAAPVAEPPRPVPQLSGIPGTTGPRRAR